MDQRQSPSALPRRTTAPDAYPYATQGKKRIREHWVQFLAAGKSSAALRTHDILFFPGERALELPLYDHLGIDRAHLHGVECDRTIAANICAAQFGFPLYTGTCAAFLKARAKADDAGRCLDGAWLDYDGHCYAYASDIDATVALLRPTRGSALSITSLVGRDREVVLDSAISVSLLRSCVPEMRFQLLADSLSRHLVGDEPPGAPDAAMTHYNMIGREISMFMLIVHAIGARNNPAFVAEMKKISSMIREQTRGEMKMRHHASPENRPYPIVTVPSVRGLFERALADVWIEDLARFGYISHVASRLMTWQFRFGAARHDRERKPLLTVVRECLDLWISRRIHLYNARGALERTPVNCQYCGQ
ncbi:hypothetical protein HY478_00825 [Candidatus Uhrbacteria bacterium]|nr:hypothetical protein [Candidatus Uhrbacteria bacterium]